MSHLDKSDNRHTRNEIGQLDSKLPPCASTRIQQLPAIATEAKEMLEQDMYIAYLEIKSEIDQDTDTQNDSESSDSGIHHAASMWVHTCLVEKPDVNLKNTLLAINEIEIHVKYSDNTILFDTVYYATDCL